MESVPPIGRRTFLGGAMAAAIASGTAACTFENNDPDTGGDAEGGGQMVLRQSELPIAHLDFQMSGSGTQGAMMQQGLWEGLLVTDAEGAEAQPGVAESWSVSDDGLVYTLPLRSDARWSNGDPVVAGDFVFSWQRLLSPDLDRGENNPSYNGSAGVVGALAYLNGETDNFDEVGVTALDDATIEFTLEQPNPDFPFFLAETTTLPVHPATVEEFPDGWLDPENFVSNGAFVLDSFQSNANAVLLKNEEYWDSDSINVDRWEWRFSDAGDSAEMVSFQADEVDLFRIEGDLASVTNDPEMAENLQSSLAGQWRHLTLVMSENEALRDINVRKALSLAIDREALAELSHPDVPGGSLVPNGVPGYDQIPQTGFDLEQARSLLADAGYPEGAGLPAINIALPFPAVWAEAIAGMWQENLGIQAAVDLVEIGVYREKRNGVNPGDYIGFAYGNIGYNPPTLYNAGTHSAYDGADFGKFLLPPDAAKDYVALGNNQNISGAERQEQQRAIYDEHLPEEWKRYEDLVEQAREELDEATRNDLLIEAAIAREESYVAIPVLWGGYSLMVSPRVQGLEVQTFTRMFSMRGVTVEEA